MDAVIIAGDTHAMADDGIPKALLPVAGVPIIFRQLRVLRREGVRHVTVLAGPLGDQFAALLTEETRSLGLALELQVEREPLGTAGWLARLASGDDTLLLYGDVLFDLALGPLREYHRAQQALVTIVAHPNDHPRTSDLIRERDGLVTAVLPREEARASDERNLVPAGLYLAAPDLFTLVPAGRKPDMIRDILPGLVASGERVAVYNTPEYMREVGTATNRASAERDILEGIIEARNLRNMRPAIFFDIDGVLNQEPGTRGALIPDDVTLVPGAGGAVAAAHRANVLTVAITNRPQIARGDITFDNLDAILGRLEALLAEDGGVLDRIYVCPHHPDRGFPGEVAALKIRCECRKPGALLFRRAIAELPIERARSSAIGDSLRDIGAARAARVWAYGVRTGYGCRDATRFPGGPETAPTPDLMFDDVGEAVRFSLSYEALAAPLVKALRERRAGHPKVIAICGRSRSGKSLIAHALVRTLTEAGNHPLLVRLDEWIQPAAERRPQDTALIRNRVNRLPKIVSALRRGQSVTAPGYDPLGRVKGKPATFDPAGHDLIVLEGVFAAHDWIRPLIDLAAFIDAPEPTQRRRFAALYRWKGFEDGANEELWHARVADEWAAVDAQREHCDVIITPESGEP